MKPSDYDLVRKIKEQVQNLPDLEIPPKNAYIILETDGCMEGWGGIVEWKKSKEDPRNSERICAYASGKFSTTQSTIDAEINACINTLEKLKIYYLDKQEELATATLYSVEEVLQFPNPFQKNMKITCKEVIKISNHFQESSQKLSLHMKSQEHYTDATSLKPTKPQSKWINLLHEDQSLKTLNCEQQKKQLKPCETYKQSYSAKPKYSLDNQPKTTTGQIKEKMFEFKIKKPEESSSSWKPWHRDWDATTSNFLEDDASNDDNKYHYNRKGFLKDDDAHSDDLVFIVDPVWDDYCLQELKLNRPVPFFPKAQRACMVVTFPGVTSSSKNSSPQLVAVISSIGVMFMGHLSVATDLIFLSWKLCLCLHRASVEDVRPSGSHFFDSFSNCSLKILLGSSKTCIFLFVPFTGSLPLMEKLSSLLAKLDIESSSAPGSSCVKIVFVKILGSVGNLHDFFAGDLFILLKGIRGL
nr:putative polyprotein [Tanacetum cinerariifolium]